MSDKFLERTELLIGEKSVASLTNSNVIVFGVGGVGGYAVESLVRSGLGSITVVDYDIIDITNINRQIIALQSTVGLSKVDVIEKRIGDINPKCHVKKLQKKVDEDNIEDFNLMEYNYVVDAIDSVSGKVAIAEYCYNNGINLISSMGAGRKLDPTRFKVSDIYKTRECPLARVMRNRLKKIGVRKLKVVWSDEKPSGEKFIDELTGKSSPSSISFVPSVAGLIIGGEVIKDLISRGD